jgi:uncharacterized protein (DUF2336 family)
VWFIGAYVLIDHAGLSVELRRVLIVEAFLKWAKTARSSDRAKAASALARAYLQSSFDGHCHDQALITLTHLVNDPSPLVRSALAKAMAPSLDAPRHILLALANDQPDVAAEVIINCSLLSDDDLIEIAACGSDLTQALIASRNCLSVGLCAALCEIADASTLLFLMNNPKAVLNAHHFDRIASRFSHLGEIRAALMDRGALLPQAQNAILRSVALDMKSNAFLSALLGSERLNHVLSESCEDALIALIEQAADKQLPEIVSTLIAEQQLSVPLLVKLCALGQGEFLVHAISELSHVETAKARKIIASGRKSSILALLRSVELPKSVQIVLCEITLYWRQAGYGDHLSLVVEHLKRAPADADFAESHFALISIIERFANQRRFHQADKDVRYMMQYAA